MYVEGMQRQFRFLRHKVKSLMFRLFVCMGNISNINNNIQDDYNNTLDTTICVISINIVICRQWRSVYFNNGNTYQQMVSSVL